MAKTINKKIAAKNKSILKKKSVMKKKLVVKKKPVLKSRLRGSRGSAMPTRSASGKKLVSKKSRRQSRRGSSMKSGPKSVIEMSKEKFDYLMAKIAAI